MTRFADRFLIESSRLTNWNYSTPGDYFITICTLNHHNFFGKIINHRIILSKIGIIAKQCLLNVPNHFSDIRLVDYVVMPNHLHALFHVETPISKSVETHHDASLQKRYQSFYFHRIAKRSIQTVPLIVKQYKSSVKRIINQNHMFFAWQSRYHDIVVNNEKELFILKKYIKNNPSQWKEDKFYVDI